jgi:hypothetical protein
MTNVRISTTALVENAGEVGWEGSEEPGDSGCLVGRAGKNVRESATGEVDCQLWLHAEGRTDGGHEWTAGWEDWGERVHRAFANAVMGSAYTAVTRGVDDGNATRAQSHVGITDFPTYGSQQTPGH